MNEEGIGMGKPCKDCKAHSGICVAVKSLSRMFKIFIPILCLLFAGTFTMHWRTSSNNAEILKTMAVEGQKLKTLGMVTKDHLKTGSDGSSWLDDNYGYAGEGK